MKNMTEEKVKQAKLILVEMDAAKTLLDEAANTWKKFNRLILVTNVRHRIIIRQLFILFSGVVRRGRRGSAEIGRRKKPFFYIGQY